MDIIFDCPHCEQELAVDSSGAGSEIECPACGETIVIPAASTKPDPEASQGGTVLTGQSVSAIQASAAARVEKHLKVPLRGSPAEPLITKAKPPLGAKPTGAKQICIRTIRHASCVESGHDRFDEKVTEFLQQIGEANVISVHTINYEHFDVGVQKVMTDFGIMVVYRG